MTVIIACGDRHATDALWLPVVRQALTRHLCPGPAVLIHGAAAGIDSIAETVAYDVPDVQILTFPADWDEYPRGDPRRNQAGPRRNARMLERLLEYRAQGDHVLVVAFHDQPDLMTARKGGTAHMVRIARTAGVPVEWWRSSGERSNA